MRTIYKGEVRQITFRVERRPAIPFTLDAALWQVWDVAGVMVDQGTPVIEGARIHVQINTTTPHYVPNRAYKLLARARVNGEVAQTIVGETMLYLAPGPV